MIQDRIVCGTNNLQVKEKLLQADALDLRKGKAVYTMQLKPEVQPVVHAARKVTVAIREKVRAELDRMEKLNVISKVDEPTMGKLDGGGTQTKRGGENLLRPICSIFHST